MSFDTLLPQTASILPTGTQSSDAEGNAVGGVGTTRTSPCRLQRVTAAESLGAQTLEDSRWRLFLPAGTALGPADRVQVDSLTFEVDGPPESVYGMNAPHHVEALLRLVVTG